LFVGYSTDDAFDGDVIIDEGLEIIEEDGFSYISYTDFSAGGLHYSHNGTSEDKELLNISVWDGEDASVANLEFNIIDEVILGLTLSPDTVTVNATDGYTISTDLFNVEYDGTSDESDFIFDISFQDNSPYQLLVDGTEASVFTFDQLNSDDVVIRAATALLQAESHFIEFTVSVDGGQSNSVELELINSPVYTDSTPVINAVTVNQSITENRTGVTVARLQILDEGDEDDLELSTTEGFVLRPINNASNGEANYTLSLERGYSLNYEEYLQDGVSEIEVAVKATNANSESVMILKLVMRIC